MTKGLTDRVGKKEGLGRKGNSQRRVGIRNGRGGGGGHPFTEKKA